MYPGFNFPLFYFLSAHLLARRLRSTVRRKFDEINTPSKEQESADSTQIKYGNNLESKVDIQLQDNGKDKIVDEENANRSTSVVN